MTLVDTNVLLDLVTNDPNWADWSIQRLDAAAMNGPLLINDAIYAELSVRFSTIEALDAVIEEAGLMMTPTPRAALFLAGKVLSAYRTRGGAKTGVLPDYFIGAHAAVSVYQLLTRDPRPYRTYFPTVSLICP